MRRGCFFLLFFPRSIAAAPVGITIEVSRRKTSKNYQIVIKRFSFVCPDEMLRVEVLFSMKELPD